MLENVEVLIHSSIKFNKEKVIYVDPFKIQETYKDADFIFITHDHYDHYSEEDINKIKKEETIIIAPETLKKQLLRITDEEHVFIVHPEQEYEVNGIKFKTIPAYNINKQFHPKENNWVGYIIELNNVLYYIAGDTDETLESNNVQCDVAFVPVGGTYTMNYKEAAALVNIIRPKVAVPIHYGSIVGSMQDGIEFVKMLNPETQGIILIK